MPSCGFEQVSKTLLFICGLKTMRLSGFAIVIVTVIVHNPL
jgi:hypothetical protein